MRALAGPQHHVAHRRRARSILTAVALVLAPSRAWAVGQGEMMASAGPGVLVSFDGQKRAGPLVDVRFLRGLSDALGARLAVQGAWLPAKDGKEPVRILMPSFGLTLSADALKLVPFVEAAVLLADMRSDDQAARVRLGGQLAAGADYLLSRHMALTAVLYANGLPLRLSGVGGSTPFGLAAALSLGYVF
jgi:hypothetical protein